MKKIFLLAVIAIALSATQSFAQSSYKTGLGLGIDFGDGSTLVGPSVKHFFNGHDVIQGDLLFGNDATWIGGFYQYHQAFREATALKWYLGIGPQVALYDGGSTFFLRPTGGLDYKIPTAPLSLTFDWRPAIRLSDGSDFEAARFGLGFRYTF
ncbi:hypothetical protein LT679_07415 [Mucilaginibacter roseus]|uniref:Outer membrane insertion C-signal n=1 Tax=Mucilaginibacter roseus TaxID=1528868 RepID=A0ABS8U2F8_9SPHI|nr:hypothetical protein [Mucilaginibacter roseus]MCD8740427.1 hypothetical protein [Mucilaginibacter roseus]